MIDIINENVGIIFNNYNNYNLTKKINYYKLKFFDHYFYSSYYNLNTNNYIELVLHYIYFGIPKQKYPCKEAKFFNYEFYINYYSDIKNYKYIDALFHYLNHGIYENRIPCKEAIYFNYDFIINNNVYLIGETYLSILHYYLHTSIKLQEPPCKEAYNFDYKYVKDKYNLNLNYVDALNFFINNFKQNYKLILPCKEAEYIDINYYKNKYSDLIHLNDNQIINHYLYHGKKEDRFCNLKQNNFDYEYIKYIKNRDEKYKNEFLIDYFNNKIKKPCYDFEVNENNYLKIIKELLIINKNFKLQFLIKLITNSNNNCNYKFSNYYYNDLYDYLLYSNNKLILNNNYFQKKNNRIYNEKLSIFNASIPKKYNIHIIYYIGIIFNDNWKSWFYYTIKLIKQINYDSFNLFILINSENIKKEIEEIIDKFNIQVKINYKYKNENEYTPLKKIWNMSRKFKKSYDLFLYFHSKDITRFTCVNMFSEIYSLIIDYENIIKIFDENYNINKVCYKSSNTGFCWFNFFWVRGSYLQKVEKPILTIRRHYYEDWIARVLKDGFPLISNNNIERKKIYDKTNIDTYSYCISNEDKEKYNVTNICYWSPIYGYNYRDLIGISPASVFKTSNIFKK